MKTIVIWDESDIGIKFFVLDGDFRHLDGVYLGQWTVKRDAQRELEKLVADGVEKTTEFPSIRRPFIVIVCGDGREER